MPSTAETLRRSCAREMDSNPRGFAGADWLRDIFLAVPREHFVPDRVWWPARDPHTGLYPLFDRTARPRQWLRAVYLPGAPLITQLDDGRTPPTAPASGVFTSSISSSGVVIELLRHLAPRPGDRVLEIGTGTGYTTALLAARAGAGNTVSVEIDRHLADRARHALATLRPGSPAPLVVTADGEHGHAAGGPYDRIVATASVRRIPGAWLEQLRPGGRLVAPLDTPFGHDLLIRLTGDGHGAGAGSCVARVEFMRVREQRAPRPYATLGWPEGLDPARWEHLSVEVGPAGQRIRDTAG
ncbi:protein-L-isoaspartate(D-aspartate) O-methyltransferase [Streptomyces sp. LP05-1]|uniref:Protein-L-isoaspartate O-methyltransferase n=1 Tax=Streptomyces pyxinae TaxID=2970734 RepID=A0ABT2CHC4_9ACTN|nr:rRNA adenine N-6-methyltransferase family protein [Streptomyces sp. LP05-1]MCS0636819.1 protein-L-isoaspartate(D-aspartate) O-methyltransferase [Streptomyces sp. LP05-1]